MDERYAHILYIARFLLLGILVVAIFIMPDYCPERCKKPPIIPPYSIVSFIVLIIIAISLAIPALCKSYRSKEEILLSLFLVVIPTLILGYLLSPFCPQALKICLFGEGPICAKVVILHSGTSELELLLSKWAFYKNEIIRVDGVKCIRSDFWGTAPPTTIEPLNGPVVLTDSDHYYNITGPNTGNRVYCTNEDGSIPVDTSPGNSACLNIFINYTNMETGNSTIIYGKVQSFYYKTQGGTND